MFRIPANTLVFYGKKEIKPERRASHITVQYRRTFPFFIPDLSLDFRFYYDSQAVLNHSLP
jgi:phosphoribosylaminoimidazole carboxylase (NCAIR synthetase)